MGELEPWIDENFVRSVWFGMGEQVNVKMIRDKFSGYDTGKPFNQIHQHLTHQTEMLVTVSSISQAPRQLRRP
jgi:hypothetical protein